MLSRISGIVARRMQVSSNKLAMPFLSVRSFSDNLSIPSDAEQQGGRRKEELDAEAAGGVAFDHRHPLVPDTDAGTKENPIMVSNLVYVGQGCDILLNTMRACHIVNSTRESTLELRKKQY